MKVKDGNEKYPKTVFENSNQSQSVKVAWQRRSHTNFETKNLKSDFLNSNVSKTSSEVVTLKLAST